MTHADDAAVPDLPMELRAGIDVVVEQTVTADGVLPVHVFGVGRLVAEYSRYGASHAGADWLVLLGADESLAKSAVAEHRPPHVVAMVAGSLSNVPIGRPAYVCEDLSRDDWRDLGYTIVGAVGIRGLGWYGWAVAERICRFFRRPDLADRCRIGTLRTLVAHGNLPFSTVVVRHYRRG